MMSEVRKEVVLFVQNNDDNEHCTSSLCEQQKAGLKCKVADLELQIN